MNLPFVRLPLPLGIGRFPELRLPIQSFLPSGSVFKAQVGRTSVLWLYLYILSKLLGSGV